MIREQKTEKITIRPMRRTDAAVVVGMTNELAKSGNKLKADFLERYCFGRRKSFYVCVAVAGGKAIGFAMVFDRANFNQNHIDGTLGYLFVEEGWRGKGVGRRLAARAAADSLKRGCVWFRTETSIRNKEAQKLYRDLGFMQRNYEPVQYLMEGKTLRQFAKEKI